MGAACAAGRCGDGVGHELRWGRARGERVMERGEAFVGEGGR